MADPFSTTNTLVQQYRSYLEAQGKIDPRPDLELTLELGNKLRAQGEDVYDAKAQQFPDFHQQYLAASQATDRSVPGEVVAGVKRGVEGLGATALGLGALGANLVGAKDTAHSLAKKAREIETPEGDEAPTVQRMKDVQDVEGGARYVAGKIGEVIPNVAEALLTSLAGSAVGTAVEPGGGTAAGAIGGLVAKNAIKQMIRKGLAEKLGETGLEAALRVGENKALQTAFVQEAKNVAARMGGEAAAYLNAAALGAGGTYNQTENPGASLASGIVGGVAGALLPGTIVRRFYPVESAEGAFMAKLGRDLPKELAIGAAGTVGQELANITAEKYARGEPASLTAKDLARLKEAAVGGAIGGAIAAPIGAAAGGERAAVAEEPAAPDAAAIEARRRAFAPPQIEQGPRVKSRGEILRDSMTLSPDLQDARVTALERLSKRTPLEDQELEVLRAQISTRPKTVANTVSNVPPPAEVPPTPVPPAVVPPAAVAPTPTPLVAEPTPAAPATPTPEVAKAPTIDSLRTRMQAAGNKLRSLMTSVPSLDVADATGQLEAFTKAGKVGADDVANFESTIASLQEKGLVEAARVAGLKAKQVADKSAARDAAKLAREQAKAEKGAAKAQAQAEAAAAAIDDSSVAPEMAKDAPGGEQPAPGAAEPAPVDDLKAKLDAALNPKPAFAAGKITEDGILNFDQGRSGMYYDQNGNGSLTRTAVALEMPDGTVVQAGLLKTKGKGLMRVGADVKATAAEVGPAVQRMSTRPTKAAPKAIEVGGRDPVLLDDLIKSGAKPFEVVKFEGDPRQIFQTFRTRQEYEAAKLNTERTTKSVATTDQGAVTAEGSNLDAAQIAEQKAAETAAQTAVPDVSVEQKLGEMFSENPNYLTAITKRMAQTRDPAAAIEKLPKLGKKQLTDALTEIAVTPDQLHAYLRDNVTLPTAAPAIEAPSAGFQKFASAVAKKPKFADRLFKLIDSAGTFDSAFEKMSDNDRSAVVDAAAKNAIEWPEFSARIQQAYDKAGGNSQGFVEQLNGVRQREQSVPAVADRSV